MSFPVFCKTIVILSDSPGRRAQEDEERGMAFISQLMSVGLAAIKNAGRKPGVQ
jgi:hypothetical protein